MKLFEITKDEFKERLKNPFKATIYKHIPEIEKRAAAFDFTLDVVESENEFKIHMINTDVTDNILTPSMLLRIIEPLKSTGYHIFFDVEHYNVSVYDAPKAKL